MWGWSTLATLAIQLLLFGLCTETFALIASRKVSLCRASIKGLESYGPTYFNRNENKKSFLYLASSSRYVPPERDPEYRKVIKKSLLQPLINITADGSIIQVNIDSEAMLPIPKEGDIVIAPGKWKEEKILARIRYIEYSQNAKMWRAEILPLKDGKSENVFVVDRGAKSSSELVENLRPVQAFFLRSENGYKVAYRRNTTEVVLKAPSYRKIDGTNFTMPTKVVNMETLQNDMIRYNELKTRMVTNTLKFGAVGTALTTVLYGTDVSLPYSLGALAGALYLILLGKKVDIIGSGFSVSSVNAKPSKLDESLAKARYLVPLLLVGVLAAKKAFIDGEAIVLGQLNILSREQFLGSMAGFLTYRLALFVTEVGAELRTEDVLSIAPGSMAEGYRQSKALSTASKLKEAAANQAPPLVTVVVITGPVAAGRTNLASSLLAKSTNKKFLTTCKMLTTDTRCWQESPEKYRLISIEELDDFRRSGQLIYEGEESGMFGRVIKTALTRDDLEAAAVGRNRASKPLPIVLEGPPALLDALSGISTLRLINIWVSLQTKEQFIEKATAIVQREALKMLTDGANIDRNDLAQKSAKQVSDLVNEAAKDVTFYMQKSPLFEYTLLNAGREEDTLDELELLLKNTM